MKALIIDDSRAMRRILSGIVASIGYDAVEAGDGQEALDILNNSDKFEFALVDWNMPVKNGLQFAKEVRADKRHCNLKMVMVTTETEVTQMVRALMAGIDEFVVKPFTVEILVQKLEMIGVSVASRV